MGPTSNLWPLLQVKLGFDEISKDKFADVMILVVISQIISTTLGMAVGSSMIKHGRRRNLLIAAAIGITGNLLMQVMQYHIYLLGVTIW
jgi:hypothetical protein